MLTCSVLYWHLACRYAGVTEPWDADAYWTGWYPASIALSAFAGFVFGRGGWSAGALVTFAQLPVMWLNADTAPIWAVALITSCVLAVPAVAISTLTGRLGARRRGS